MLGRWRGAGRCCVMRGCPPVWSVMCGARRRERPALRDALFGAEASPLAWRASKPSSPVMGKGKRAQACTWRSGARWTPAAAAWTCRSGCRRARWLPWACACRPRPCCRWR